MRRVQLLSVWVRGCLLAEGEETGQARFSWRKTEVTKMPGSGRGGALHSSLGNSKGTGEGWQVGEGFLGEVAPLPDSGLSTFPLHHCTRFLIALLLISSSPDCMSFNFVLEKNLKFRLF